MRTNRLERAVFPRCLALVLTCVLLFTGCVSSLGTVQTPKPGVLLPTEPDGQEPSVESSAFFSPSLDDPSSKEDFSEPSPLPSSSSSSSSSLSRDELVTAVYLGVHEAGEQKSDFTYRFLIDKQEHILKIAADDHFSIQNSIKVGYSYELVLEEDTVTHTAELTSSLTHPLLPPVSVRPGEKTLKNLLATALLPMGNALYVYGGGWNWQDNGSSAQTKSVGVSPYWSDFFHAQNATYSYKEPNGKKGTVYYPILGVNEYYFAGLDCSGYLGWVLYNTLQNESGKEGFVTSSTKFAKSLEQKGLGSVSSSCKELLPGDIVSIKGHVWLCIGQCDDGSVVIAHSTPSSSRKGSAGGGVQLSALGVDKNCEAYQLADHYMKEYFPQWYERYGVILCNPSKYTDLSVQNTGRFSFNTSSNGVLSDEEGLRTMSARDVLSLIFGECADQKVHLAQDRAS